MSLAELVAQLFRMFAKVPVFFDSLVVPLLRVAIECSAWWRCSRSIDQTRVLRSNDPTIGVTTSIMKVRDLLKVFTDAASLYNYLV